MVYGRGPWRIVNRGGGFSFSNNDRRRDYPSPREYRMKVKISSFSGNLDIKSLDWVYEIEKFFDMAYVPQEKHVKFVAYKLKEGAAAWWDQLQITRRHQGKPPMMTWRNTKQLLQGRFLPPDYQQIFYNQFEHCKQSTRTIAAYTEEFYCLSSRCELFMTDEQQTIKYQRVKVPHPRTHVPS